MRNRLLEIADKEGKHKQSLLPFNDKRHRKNARRDDSAHRDSISDSNEPNKPQRVRREPSEPIKVRSVRVAFRSERRKQKHRVQLSRVLGIVP